MSDAAVSLGDVDVLELAVHVVFGFDELSAVCLSGVDLDSHLMALESEREVSYARSGCKRALAMYWRRGSTYSSLVEELDRDTDCRSHGRGAIYTVWRIRRASSGVRGDMVFEVSREDEGVWLVVCSRRCKDSSSSHLSRIYLAPCTDQ